MLYYVFLCIYFVNMCKLIKLRRKNDTNNNSKKEELVFWNSTIDDAFVKAFVYQHNMKIK